MATRTRQAAPVLYPRNGHWTKANELARADLCARLFYLCFSAFTICMIVPYWLEAFGGVFWLRGWHANNWEVPVVGVSLYSTLLATYITNKELSRWCLRKHTTRRGGRWVVAWWASFYVMFVCAVLFDTVKVPKHLPLQCVIVLLAFFGSETAKTLFIRRHQNGITSE